MIALLLLAQDFFPWRDREVEVRPGGGIGRIVLDGSWPREVERLEAELTDPPANRWTLRVFIVRDDGVKLWVNGDLVHERHEHRPVVPDQDRVEVWLRAGWNRVLAMVDQGVGGWGLSLRFSRPDGTVAGLEFSAARPAGTIAGRPHRLDIRVAGHSYVLFGFVPDAARR